MLNPLARKNQRDEHEDSVREPVIRDFEQLKAAIKSELEKYTDIKLEEKEHDLNVFAANGRWEFISSTGIFRFASFQKKTIRYLQNDLIKHISCVPHIFVVNFSRSQALSPAKN